MGKKWKWEEICGVCIFERSRNSSDRHNFVGEEKQLAAEANF